MNDFLLQMAEKADDGIIYVSVDGNIRYWNAGCEKIFGFGADEVMGKNLDIIIPEKHRQRHWDGFYQVAESGETKYRDKMLKVPALTKDGRKLIIQFSMQMITENDKIVGFSSIIRDVTPA
ncbi:MAG: PAS domain S-box protein [Deferribacterales bacterium]